MAALLALGSAPLHFRRRRGLHLRSRHLCAAHFDARHLRTAHLDAGRLHALRLDARRFTLYHAFFVAPLALHLALHFALHRRFAPHFRSRRNHAWLDDRCRDGWCRWCRGDRSNDARLHCRFGTSFFTARLELPAFALFDARRVPLRFPPAGLRPLRRDDRGLPGRTLLGVRRRASLGRGIARLAQFARLADALLAMHRLEARPRRRGVAPMFALGSEADRMIAADGAQLDARREGQARAMDAAMAELVFAHGDDGRTDAAIAVRVALMVIGDARAAPAAPPG